MSNPKTKGHKGRMSPSNASKKPASDRRTRGERRSTADSRREHARFTPDKKKSSERRQSDRRDGQS